ncbi:MAG: DUF3052 family protein [Candidatus Dormibacteraeota bacterium]|nr:DUF3052 family protein [Candidatus Dormibacteraeota bacterium]MBO0762260.1 DUF3052 family protein [Candidatus Dormibacteraeota bacterium]
MDQKAEIARKVGIKPDSRVLVVGGPADLGGVHPDGAEQPDVVVAYFREASHLRGEVARLGDLIFPNGMLWIAWPRKAAGHRSDIDENLIREVVLPLGLVDTKVAALGEDWSGLRVVWRKERRG